MQTDDLPPMPSSEPGTVLVVASDSAFFARVQQSVAPHGCLAAQDLAAAIAIIDRGDVEAVVLDFDQTVPMTGMDILLGLCDHDRGLPLFYPSHDAFSPSVFRLIEMGQYGSVRKTRVGYVLLGHKVAEAIFVERRMCAWFPVLWGFVGAMREALEPTVRVHDADVAPLDDDALRDWLEAALRRELKRAFHRPPPSPEETEALLHTLPRSLEQVVFGYVVERIGSRRAAARALEMPAAELAQILAGDESDESG